ncbi:hypothetical protein LCGC14_2782750 [marine sediment metagenome]|uniref:Uncharacterized protein n=1 Tax=marine sediment metagenome TaxID=412755 RepID=A0A0F8YSU5_9ZZZZ
MNILCRVGIHWPLKPLKNRAVRDLRDIRICKRCLATQTDNGWHRYGDEEQYWDENYIRELELGAYSVALSHFGIPERLHTKLFEEKAKELGIKTYG